MRTRLGVLSVLLGLAILGTSWWVIVTGRVVLDSTTNEQPSPTQALPACPNPGTSPLLPVTTEWQEAITAHYAAESLTVTTVDDQAELLDVRRHRLGQYACVDGDGTIGAYRGMVPLDAIAAVRVRVEIDTTDYTRSPAWLTLASSGNGWSIVDIQGGQGASIAVPQEE